MEAAGLHLPAFELVPRKFRHDGWTPYRQRAFIAALADTAARPAIVGMTAVGAHYPRRQPGAESFACAWRAAQAGTAPAPLDLPPLTLRGMMHMLEAAARRHRVAAPASGLSGNQTDKMNAELIKDFDPAR